MTKTTLIDPVRISGIVLIVGALIGSILASGDPFVFFHIPSLILISLVPIILFFKHGKLAFTFKVNEEVREKLIFDSYVITALVTGISITSGYVVMLENLSDKAAIGPAMAVATLGMIYALFMYLFILFPFSTKPAPKILLLLPITGTPIVLLTLFILLTPFSKT